TCRTVRTSSSSTRPTTTTRPLTCPARTACAPWPRRSMPPPPPPPDPARTRVRPQDGRTRVPAPRHPPEPPDGPPVPVLAPQEARTMTTTLPTTVESRVVPTEYDVETDAQGRVVLV